MNLPSPCCRGFEEKGDGGERCQGLSSGENSRVVSGRTHLLACSAMFLAGRCKGLLLTLVLLFPLACSPPPSPSTPRSSSLQIALWSEFLPLEKVQESLPTLSRYGLGLYQSVHTEGMTSSTYREGLSQLLSRSVALGLDTRAWILLPYAQGYWPNEENRFSFLKAARAWMEWAREQGVPVSWIVVDMEPSYQDAQELLLASRTNDLALALRVFRKNRNPRAFLEAKETYGELIALAHSLGFKVMCVTFPLVLDDLADGDDDLQDYLNLPVRGLPWDELSFMVYRTTVYDLGVTGITSYFVYSYARTASLSYGEKAGIDIGLVAPPDLTTPEGGLSGYTNPFPLQEDFLAAIAAGVRRIHIWPLDHLILYPDLEPWIALPPVPPPPPPGDESTEGLRLGIQLLDEALNEKAHGG